MLSTLVSLGSRLLPALANHAVPLLPQLIVSTVTHLVTRETSAPSSNTSPSPPDAKRA